MKTTAKRDKALKLNAELVANTDALYAGRLTHEKHSATNRDIWDRVESSGVRDLVLALLRDDEQQFDSVEQARQ